MVNPNMAVCWRLQGWVNMFVGRHESALEQICHAMCLQDVFGRLGFVIAPDPSFSRHAP
jgi:hypothetical protein